MQIVMPQDDPSEKAGIVLLTIHSYKNIENFFVKKVS
jgi:hypothetical protein